jgi:hypothetical protein
MYIGSGFDPRGSERLDGAVTNRSLRTGSPGVAEYDISTT